MVTTEDREIELECVSENGKPAAEVHTHTQNKTKNISPFEIVYKLCLEGVHATDAHVSNVPFLVAKRQKRLFATWVLSIQKPGQKQNRLTASLDDVVISLPKSIICSSPHSNLKCRRFAGVFA